MGLVFSCENTPVEKHKRQEYKPIDSRPKPTDNYTTTDWDWNRAEKCFRNNFKPMVGMTFMAYPRGTPFNESNEWLSKSFGVISPEKFTVISVQNGMLKIKFESGKIGYIDMTNPFNAHALKNVSPDFEECININLKVCS